RAGAMWYKNAIIYSLDVETFMDGNGDGTGDFQGLIDRIDHLENLGVTCVWLQPHYPSPNRDDGYDVMDFYGVDPRLGSAGEFAEFSHALKERGIRLILDLVVNHTSIEHPWFRRACEDPSSPWRDFYLWAEEKPADADRGMVFPGVQETTWTWCEQAGAYYHHRFFDHQPDLNITNPAVRQEILRIMGYWLQLGVSGFRVDAAPFLIEIADPERAARGERDRRGDGRDAEEERQDEAMFAFLREMHDFLSWRSGDGVLLAEANVAPDRIRAYFGDGDRMHMLFNFLVNQPMFLAFARQEAAPLIEALRALPEIPRQGQWAQFLRTHDELDLGRLSEAERREVFEAFGPEPGMQLYGRGIRRRLAPMFGNDRRRLEMAHSLIFSLPGTQVIRYGDEIGMGDDLALEDRLAVRTPMQWSDAPNGGFSDAPPDEVFRPVIAGGEYGYAKVNVQAQQQDPDSLLNRVEQLIRARRSCREIGEGTMTLLEVDEPGVLAHRSDGGGRSVLALHNLADRPCRVRLESMGGDRLRNLVGNRRYPPAGEAVELDAWGYRWLRVGR
ncbi:MAG TPA: alpha-amylase family protein, partial [Geminicoccaceae bacterium]|nr:alpha-amylase family protein [Geminicoccaceae bacterium]